MKVKEKQEALEWFVDFANVNLEAIKPGDKAKLLIESEEYLFPREEIKAFDSIREELVNEMPWVFNQPPKESRKYWDNLTTLQGNVKQVFMGRSEHPYPVKGIQILPWSTAFIRLKTITKIERGQGKEPYRLFNLAVTKNQGEYVWFKIDSLLEDLPSHTIQKCPGCRKYFVNTSLREKTFCSPRCMWRVNTAKRREADREGYNKYQAKLMRDRYREKNGLPRLKTKSRKAKGKGQ